MQTRHFDHDLLTGRTELFHFDETDETFTIESVEDVETLIDENKAYFNEEILPGQDIRRVASIPLVILMQLQEEGILDDRPAFRRWLNDRDNRFFRTSDERV